MNSNITTAGLLADPVVAHLVTLFSAVDKDAIQVGGQRFVDEVYSVLTRIRCPLILATSAALATSNLKVEKCVKLWLYLVVSRHFKPPP